VPKISDDKRSDRRRQIAEAALRCFMRNGFEATSMGDIIAESGLSAGAIYLHYENKQDLIRRVVRDVFIERATELAELAKRDPLPDPAQVVREFVERMRDAAGADIRLHAWSTCLRDPEMGQLMTDYAADRHANYRNYVEAWLMWRGLPEAVAAERADGLAEVIIGICQGFVAQTSLVKGFDPEGYLRAIELIDLSGGAAIAGKGASA
jgi:AcrR family transcriptional regulator